MSDAPIESLRIAASVVTDRGCVRPSNEDTAVFVQPSDDDELAARGVLAVVADGMGGHRAGEIASALAVEAIRRVYYGGHPDGKEPAAVLEEAFAEANRAIFECAADDDELSGMGTTCTALAVRRGLGYLAHVGDSRLYLLRGSDMLQMSEDHTHVADLVREGLLTTEQAERHEQRNVLTRALGTAPEVEVATWPEPFVLRPGDRLLLSTDGLHEPLQRREIHELAVDGDLHESCRRLVAAAKKAGAPDNVSVALLEVREPGDGDGKPTDTRELEIVP